MKARTYWGIKTNMSADSLPDDSYWHLNEKNIDNTISENCYKDFDTKWSPGGISYQNACKEFHDQIKTCDEKTINNLFYDAFYIVSKKVPSLISGILHTCSLDQYDQKPYTTWDIVESRLVSDDKLSGIATTLGYSSTSELKKSNEEIKSPLLKKWESERQVKLQKDPDFDKKIVSAREIGKLEKISENNIDIKKEEAEKIIQKINQLESKSPEKYSNLIKAMDNIAETSFYPEYDVYNPKIRKLLNYIQTKLFEEKNEYQKTFINVDPKPKTVTKVSISQEVYLKFRDELGWANDTTLMSLLCSQYLDEGDLYRLMEQKNAAGKIYSLIDSLRYDKSDILTNTNLKKIIRKISNIDPLHEAIHHLRSICLLDDKYLDLILRHSGQSNNLVAIIDILDKMNLLSDANLELVVHQLGNVKRIIDITSHLEKCLRSKTPVSDHQLREILNGSSLFPLFLNKSDNKKIETKLKSEKELKNEKEIKDFLIIGEKISLDEGDRMLKELTASGSSNTSLLFEYMDTCMRLQGCSIFAHRGIVKVYFDKLKSQPKLTLTKK